MADKVALITGGTRGIGLGIAKTLVREGFALMVCGVRVPGVRGGDRAAVAQTETARRRDACLGQAPVQVNRHQEVAGRPFAHQRTVLDFDIAEFLKIV